MSKLIGTAPNQVPSNADLGTMAYQDYDVVAPVLKGGRRNLIINGGFNVWQRSETGSAVNAFAYASADRWEMVRSSLDKATDSNGKTYAKVICGNWADNNYISQHIEATGLGLGGKEFTFSFNINSPTLSDGRVYVRSSTNGGSSWSTVIWDDGEFTYNSTDTRYSFTATLPSGAIDQIQVFIYGHRNTTNENGEYFNVSDVQFELGSVATPFEQRSYGEELALCQRYYQEFTNVPLFSYNSTSLWGTFTPSVPFRAVPSVSLTAAAKIDYVGVTAYTQSSANVSAWATSDYAEESKYITLLLHNFTSLPNREQFLVRDDGGYFKMDAEL